MLSLKQNTKKIKISVAIVFYNPSIENIKQVVDSINCLNSMTSFNFSFFLIDNASTKNKLSNKAFRSQKNVSIIKLYSNNGFGAGHNSIIKQLDSDYHIIMNPDVSINDLTGFTKAINYLETHSSVAMVSPLVRNQSDDNIQYLNRKLPTVFDLFIRFLGPNFFKKRQDEFVKKNNGYDHIQEEENATGSFMIIRTNIFKKINGFDTKFFMYFEDTDLTRRVSKFGKVMFFPYFTIIHGWKRENHSLKGIFPMLSSMITYFNKWGWKWI